MTLMIGKYEWYYLVHVSLAWFELPRHRASHGALQRMSSLRRDPGSSSFLTSRLINGQICSCRSFDFYPCWAAADLQKLCLSGRFRWEEYTLSNYLLNVVLRPLKGSSRSVSCLGCCEPPEEPAYGQKSPIFFVDVRL